MKILSRLKLIWWAVWYGRIRFTVTRVGPDQTKGYKQRWVLELTAISEDFRVVTADDQVAADAQSHQDLVAHYRDHFADEDLQSEIRPIVAEAIDAVRDTPSQNLDGSPGATIRQLTPRCDPLDYVDEDADADERERRIQQSFEDRQPK